MIRFQCFLLSGTMLVLQYDLEPEIQTECANPIQSLHCWLGFY